MPHPRLSAQEVCRRGREFYESRLRRQVETEENIGKLISIDIETGEYEIGLDSSLEAPRRLRERNPDAAIYTHRIGYNAVYALGGVLERTP